MPCARSPLAADGALDRLVLVGGPPRAGTTFLARTLNAHPALAVAIDNAVYESWALYRYRFRSGLIAELQQRELTAREARMTLADSLVRDGEVWGVAPSDSVEDCPLVPAPRRPAEPVVGGGRGLVGALRRMFRRIVPHRGDIVRHRVPLHRFQDGRLRLCLKSPEVTLALPGLGRAFPDAQFLVVYRSALEIAESMFRKGVEWPLAFQKRWANERDETGRRVPPPNVWPDWRPLWGDVTDFQRCLLVAASYLRVLARDAGELATSGRLFLYDHDELRTDAAAVLERLAGFLGVDAAGFQWGRERVRGDHPDVPSGMRAEYDALSDTLGLDRWVGAPLRSIGGAT